MPRYAQVVAPNSQIFAESGPAGATAAAAYGIGSGITTNRYRKVLEAGVTFPGGVYSGEDRGWQQGQLLDFEIPLAQYEQMMYSSVVAFRVNPMARRLIEMSTEFIIGNGVSLVSQDVATAALIKRWWINKFNQWPTKLHMRLRALGIMGEWLHRPFISERDHMLYIADARTDVIEAVWPDPYNHSEIDKVVLKQLSVPSTAMSAGNGSVIGTGNDANNYETKRSVPVDVVRHRLLGASGNAPFLQEQASGDLFYFGINRLVGTYRGVGDLFHELDYLNLFDDMVYSRAEKVMAMARMWWDLKIEAVDQTAVNAMVKKLTSVPPKPGGLFAHNEKMELNAKSADLKADDFNTDVSGLKSLIINTSGGWPGTWFDSPGDAGRAVGAEMSEPATKAVINKQMIISNFLREEIDYYLEQCEAWGIWTRPSNLTQDELYGIVFNKPTAKDFQRLGPALSKVASLIESLVTKTAIFEKKEGRQLMVGILNQLGLLEMPIKIELPVSLEPDIDPITGKQLPPMTERPLPPGADDKTNDPDGTGTDAPANKETPSTKQEMLDQFKHVLGPVATAKLIEVLNLGDDSPVTSE